MENPAEAARGSALKAVAEAAARAAAIAAWMAWRETYTYSMERGGDWNSAVAQNASVAAATAAANVVAAAVAARVYAVKES